ncbi:MAG: flagellar protein FlaG [Gammaproteobacteria bacterium]|nr:flagellar protein FlaG [Gammaproteobacteria bacterium]MCF6261225.1 flagellar protein FlaG [Gammaproteobacteria bacterium]
MDVSDLIKTGSVPSSIARQSPVTSGNSLPDARQVRVPIEARQDVTPVLQPDTEELNKLVEQVNMTLQGRFSDLKFTVAEGTDINIVRIEDAETGELIRQIPSEAMVAIARALDEAQQGMMFEERV